MANLEIGIVGVPGCGKTTVVNALTGGTLDTGGYAGTKANLAIANVPDPRLQQLAASVGARKITAATMQLVDLPGIDPEGKGAGELLGQVRQVDALIHVVRCFDAGGVPPQPQEDVEGLEVALVAADADHADRQLTAARARAKSGDKAARQRVEELERFLAHLNDGAAARTYPGKVPVGLDLLTDKPVLFVANTAEDGSPDEVAVVEQLAAEAGGGCVAMCAQIEAEIAALEPEEAAGFMRELGITEPTVDRVGQAAFKLLDLITFFTVGEKETRAWLVRRGDDAQTAAGKIHTDIARGFIRAEVISADDLIELGSHAAAASAGKQRLEGKTYVVQDGDTLNVRFNV